MLSLTAGCRMHCTNAIRQRLTGCLSCHCRQILRKIVDTKTAMGETLRASAFALTEAKYAAGDFRHTVFDNVGTASVKVGSRPAVLLPAYRHHTC